MPRRRTLSPNVSRLIKIAALSDDETTAVPIRGVRGMPDRGARRLRKPDLFDDVDELAEEELKVVADDDASDAGDDEEAEDGDKGDEEDEDAERYVVEKIMGHMLDKDGSIKYKVKWEGYEKKADQSWEPETILLEDAPDVLNEYLKSVGGREDILEQSSKAAKTKKRGRLSASASESAPKRTRKNGTHPLDSIPPEAARKLEFKPPTGSWEDLIETLDACQDEITHKLIIYATWKNGHKSRHDASVIYKRCPQKMLQFYERHVKIIQVTDSEENSPVI